MSVDFESLKAVAATSAARTREHEQLIAGLSFEITAVESRVANEVTERAAAIDAVNELLSKHSQSVLEQLASSVEQIEATSAQNYTSVMDSLQQLKALVNSDRSMKRWNDNMSKLNAEMDNFKNEMNVEIKRRHDAEVSLESQLSSTAHRLDSEFQEISRKVDAEITSLRNDLTTYFEEASKKDSQFQKEMRHSLSSLTQEVTEEQNARAICVEKFTEDLNMTLKKFQEAILSV